MEIFRHMNLTKFDFLVNKIKNEIAEWRVVDVLFDATRAPEPDFTLQQLDDCFGVIDGVIFQMKKDEFVLLVKLGREPNLDTVKTGIAKKFPDHKCSVEINDLSRNGLQTIKIRMKALSLAPDAPGTPEKKKQERKFFIIDDDLFLRKTLNHILSSRGTVLEFPDGEDVIKNYLAEKPDIVFVDLHLPGRSGIDILNSILARDAAANVIIISADSTADNVLQAQAKGSKGFLGKPPNKEKVYKIITALTG